MIKINGFEIPKVDFVGEYKRVGTKYARAAMNKFLTGRGLPMSEFKVRQSVRQHESSEKDEQRKD